MKDPYRCGCGFVYCFPGNLSNFGPLDSVPHCGEWCYRAHVSQHTEWNKVFGNIPPNTPSFSGISSLTALPNPGKPGKWCHSCESRINVSDHVCKGIDTSKDFIDLMIDITKREKHD